MIAIYEEAKQESIATFALTDRFRSNTPLSVGQGL
jgi:hypothetical protein